MAERGVRAGRAGVLPASASVLPPPVATCRHLSLARDHAGLCCNGTQPSASSWRSLDDGVVAQRRVAAGHLAAVDKDLRRGPGARRGGCGRGAAPRGAAGCRRHPGAALAAAPLCCPPPPALTRTSCCCVLPSHACPPQTRPPLGTPRTPAPPPWPAAPCALAALTCTNSEEASGAKLPSSSRRPPASTHARWRCRSLKHWVWDASRRRPPGPGNTSTGCLKESGWAVLVRLYSAPLPGCEQQQGGGREPVAGWGVVAAWDVHGARVLGARSPLRCSAPCGTRAGGGQSCAGCCTVCLHPSNAPLGRCRWACQCRRSRAQPLPCR